jgi:hypothetical protein
MDSRESTISTYGKRLLLARDWLKYWKQEEELSRKKLLVVMEPDSTHEFPDMVIGAYVHERRAINPTRVRDEYPDVAEICTEITTHTRIEIHRKGDARKKKRMPSPPSGAPSLREKLDSPRHIESLIQQHLPPTEEMLPGE